MQGSAFGFFLVLFFALGEDDPEQDCRNADADNDPEPDRSAGGGDNGNDFRFGLTAVLAGKHLFAGLLLRRLLGHGTLCLLYTSPSPRD